MQLCVRSAKFLVLVNGLPNGFFSVSRGLRQGDPLSPYLFVVIMEAFSRMLDKGVEMGLVKGFSVDRFEFLISHLQYADDTLLFCEAEIQKVEHLWAIIVSFEVVLGLKVNLCKSKFLGIGIPIELKLYASILGCRDGSFPASYLSLPLCVGKPPKHVWEVIERFERKLSRWQNRHLLLGGKITLFKSAMSNLLVYCLYLFKCPKLVLLKLEKLRREFLLGGMGDKKKNHLVKWEEVCRPWDQGGAGLTKLEEMNLVLMGNWVWRFGVELVTLGEGC
ncbi:uncharacterized protein LOC131236882 [Magnolia sinica]|uniref:uncharacterized protein LOC131236882 n=1 Tax=Magnolia sinica TaxID=86752 RepID=UPI00265AA824|nr:uncharacterized protein LOC131236882 [Magnolia sinica]